jgi:hypothetical protein
MLSDNCFSVYLFHAPILIGVTLAMRSFDAPEVNEICLCNPFGRSRHILGQQLGISPNPALEAHSLDAQIAQLQAYGQLAGRSYRGGSNL